ncbi:hypothetical protein HDV00_004085 [Rhizophlyctis rosea]|nr:hypothetical protein HDV00_004085 [Rhizophlyctis rosea]
MTDPSTLAKELIQSGFVGKVVPRSEAAPYARARRVYNPRLTTRPVLVAYGTSVDDICRVVEFAISKELSRSVRSGGHSYEGLCLGREKGIAVDVSALNLVDIVDSAAGAGKKCIVGGGTRMGCLSRRLLDHENGIWQIPMGLCPGVGIGGLATGGGYGITSRFLGLTADYIRRMTIVTADGKLLEITEQSHPDLFWALTGGGGAFGIVVQFEFELVKIPEACRLQTFWEDNIEDVMRAWVHWAPAADAKMTTQLDVTAEGATLNGKFVGPVSDLGTVIEPLLSKAPNPKSHRLTPLESPLFPVDDATKVERDWNCENEPAFQDNSDKKKSDYVYNTVIQFESYGGIFTHQSSSMSPFPHRGPEVTFSIQYYVMWETDNEDMRKEREGAIKKFEEDVRPGTEEVVGGRYFGDNWARLKEIKDAVDPKGVLGPILGNRRFDRE